MDIVNYSWPNITNINQISLGCGYDLSPNMKAKFVDEETIKEEWERSTSKLLKIINQ